MVEQITYYLNILQGIIFLIVISGALYGFVVGRLPHWVGSLVMWEDEDGNEVTLPDLTEKIDETRRTVCSLEEQSEGFSKGLHDVKVAQVDIAEAVNNPNRKVPVGQLEEMHFGGDGPRRGDFVVDDDDIDRLGDQ